MYVCRLCNTEYPFKSEYTKHINRKRGCISTKEMLKMITNEKSVKNCNNNSGIIVGGDMNVNIQFVFNQYGQETVDHVDNISEKLTNNWEKGILEMVKDIYVNKDQKQNHTIFVPDPSRTTARIYNGNKFESQVFQKWYEVMESKIKETIEEFIDKEQNEKVKENQRKRLMIMLEEIEAARNPESDLSERKRFKKLTKDIRNLLYTNREIVKQTHQ